MNGLVRDGVSPEYWETDTKMSETTSAEVTAVEVVYVGPTSRETLFSWSKK